MKLTLHVWRQNNAADGGRFQKFTRDNVIPQLVLEMLDGLNEELIESGQEPIAFDHDCREGICGSCGMVINGFAHGHRELTTTCQLHMREFSDGDDVWIEPWRADAFPVVRDLVVDRSAFDRVIQAGGYISVNTGSARDANETPIAKKLPQRRSGVYWMWRVRGVSKRVHALYCRKIAHLGLVPQGQQSASTG